MRARHWKVKRRRVAAAVAILTTTAGVRLAWAGAPSVASGARVAAGGVVEGAQREIQLRFEPVGVLAQIVAVEGAKVKKGDILARLDSAVWDAQVVEAQAGVRLAQEQRERLANGQRAETRAVARAVVQASLSRFEQAKSRMARGEQLHAKKAMPQQDLDDLRADFRAAQAAYEADQARLAEVEAPARVDDLKVADAQIESAKAKLRSAQVQQAKTKLLAPVDGLVLRVQGEVGESAGGAASSPVVTMVNVDVIRVRCYVEEIDALKVQTAQSAYATADGLPGERFGGKVVACAPFLTPKKLFRNAPGERVDVKVREVLIELAPQSKLVVGLPVDVFVSIEQP